MATEHGSLVACLPSVPGDTICLRNLLSNIQRDGELESVPLGWNDSIVIRSKWMGSIIKQPQILTENSSNFSLDYRGQRRRYSGLGKRGVNA